ncbi:MAG: serine O-acetyltransferase [Pseudomonadota bacterium]
MSSSSLSPAVAQDANETTASEPLRLDPVWTRVREDAEVAAAGEPALSSLIASTILNQPSLEAAVTHRVASRLGSPEVGADLLRQTFRQAIDADPDISQAIRADLVAVHERDPACERFLDAVLYFKGYQALQAHRFAHQLLRDGRRDMALHVQSRSSAVFGVDINPAARIGRGIMIDHATGIVVGETATIGDGASIMQGVTLGGTGKVGGDRHPKIGPGVLIGAGAKVLGNITVGRCSRIASGSVVLKEVPPCTTVAGVPAKVVGEAGCPEPARSMDQSLRDPEPAPPQGE